MLKHVIFAIVVLFVISLLVGTFFYYWMQKDKTFLPRFVRENVYIKLPPDIKEYIKNDLRLIYKWIYREAREHNPPGDLVPDNLDDKIKNEIKERIN